MSWKKRFGECEGFNMRLSLRKALTLTIPIARGFKRWLLLLLSWKEGSIR